MSAPRRLEVAGVLPSPEELKRAKREKLTLWKRAPRAADLLVVADEAERAGLASVAAFLHAEAARSSGELLWLKLGKRWAWVSRDVGTVVAGVAGAVLGELVRGAMRGEYPRPAPEKGRAFEGLPYFSHALPQNESKREG